MPGLLYIDLQGNTKQMVGNNGGGITPFSALESAIDKGLEMAKVSTSVSEANRVPGPCAKHESCMICPHFNADRGSCR